jgi:hypothetical protein
MHKTASHHPPRRAVEDGFTCHTYPLTLWRRVELNQRTAHASRMLLSGTPFSKCRRAHCNAAMSAYHTSVRGRGHCPTCLPEMMATAVEGGPSAVVSAFEAELGIAQ